MAVRAASLMDTPVAAARAGAAGSTAVALVATIVSSNPEEARAATRRLGPGCGRVKPDIVRCRDARWRAPVVVGVMWCLSMVLRGELSGSGGDHPMRRSAFHPKALVGHTRRFPRPCHFSDRREAPGGGRVRTQPK